MAVECPTPWKEPHTKSTVKSQLRGMEARHKKSKLPMRPLQSYKCICGAHHVAGRKDRRHQ